MDAGQPSRTALATAAARAAHLIVDRRPWIFEDTLAAALLGEQIDDLIAPHHDDGTAGVLAAMRKQLLEALGSVCCWGQAWTPSVTARRWRRSSTSSRLIIPRRRRGSADGSRRLGSRSQIGSGSFRSISGLTR